MGCHTWFYRKSKLPNVDKDTMKQTIEKYYSEKILYANNMIKENKYNKKIRNDIYKEKERKSEKNQWLKFKGYFLERTKEINIMDDIELMSEYLWSIEQSHSVINDIFYEKAEYGDLFRHYDYDAEELNSLEETLDFIKKHDCKGSPYYNKTGEYIIPEPNYEVIKEFWEKYPDGIIEFG